MKDSRGGGGGGGGMGKYSRYKPLITNIHARINFRVLNISELDSYHENAENIKLLENISKPCIVLELSSDCCQASP